MRRRKFIALLGSSAAAWPLAARAQQPTMPVIGFLHPNSPEPSANQVAAFRKGLSESGYIEGQNVTIEYRWAQNETEQLPALAADLVRRRVAVIVALFSTAAALAAKNATTTIPIVFYTGGDPVQAGLVASISRPGANVTGITTMALELAAKRLGLLHELLPAAARFAVLVNPNSSLTEPVVTDVQAAALTIGRQIEVFTAATSRDIDAAFASMVKKGTDALLFGPDPLFINRRVQIVTLAARHAVPAIYTLREYAEAGGLMSYGPSNVDYIRQTALYAGRILKGDKPADLPVQQAAKFEFVINLQTAKTLGIEVPATLLARADEVIE